MLKSFIHIHETMGECPFHDAQHKSTLHTVYECELYVVLLDTDGE